MIPNYLYKSSPENEKTFLYIKLDQTKCLCFAFLFPSSVLLLLFSFSASFLFGTQQKLTHPPVKSSTLPQNIRKKYYALPQESLSLHNFYSNDNMKF